MRSGGIGASVSSWISENLLEELDHEVIRLSSQDVPTAYAKLLEDGTCAARTRRELHAPILTSDTCYLLQPPLCRPRTSWPLSRRSATEATQALACLPCNANHMCLTVLRGTSVSLPSNQLQRHELCKPAISSTSTRSMSASDSGRNTSRNCDDAPAASPPSAVTRSTRCVLVNSSLATCAARKAQHCIGPSLAAARAPYHSVHAVAPERGFGFHPQYVIIGLQLERDDKGGRCPALPQLACVRQARDSVSLCPCQDSACTACPHQ